MNEERIRERLDSELFEEVHQEIKSGARQTYEGKLLEWEYRYQAKRSIKGLMLTGQPDPEVTPLSDPYPGCSDKGNPISMSLTMSLVPNVMTGHMGASPYTESRIADEKGLQPKGDIDDFLFYAYQKSNVRALRRKTLISGYKYGEGVEKIVFVPETRTITETRLLLMTKSKKKVLFGPEGKEVELFDPEMDLTKLIDEMLQGEDPRSQFARIAGRQKEQGGLGLSPQQAREAAGFDVKGEVGEQSVRVAPLVQGEAGPMADWSKSTTYYPTKQEVTEEIVVSRWPKLMKVPTKDFLWPSDGKTNDLMDYWCGDRGPQDLEWLIARKKSGTDDIDGFYPEAVDLIVNRYANRIEQGEEKLANQKPEVIEIYTKFVLEKDDVKDDNYMNETEIIVWWAGDEEDGYELMGWMVNPANRFEMHHIKPYFMFQPKPRDEGVHGLCIPETCTGARDTADWVLNTMLDRQALYNDPTVVMDPKSFQNEQNVLKTGLGKRWIKADGGSIDILQVNHPESINMEIVSQMVYECRIMWGASEQLSGQRTKTDSGTAAEANLLAAKAAQQFQDSVESISQTADLQYEYIRQFYILNEPGDMKVPVRGENGDGSLVEVTRKMFEGPVLIRSRRVATESEREMRIGALKEAMGFLAQTQSPLMRDPQFVMETTKEFFDALNLENVTIPTKEQLMQSQAQMMAMQKQIEEKESLDKAAEKIPNKGVRNQVQTFLDNPKEAGKMGAPATSPNQAPGMTQNAVQGIDQIGGLR